MLQHEIKVYVGSSVEIELRAEGGVERSQGKAKRVVDQRQVCTTSAAAQVDT
jgi:phenylacetate-CoA ligase